MILSRVVAGHPYMASGPLAWSARVVRAQARKVWEETERGRVMNIRAWSLPPLLDLFGDTLIWLIGTCPLHEYYTSLKVTMKQRSRPEWQPGGPWRL